VSIDLILAGRMKSFGGLWFTIPAPRNFDKNMIQNASRQDTQQ